GRGPKSLIDYAVAPRELEQSRNLLRALDRFRDHDRTPRWFGGRDYGTSPKSLGLSPTGFGLPPDPVVLAVIGRAAPHRAVLAVEQDGIDWTGGLLNHFQLVTHLHELRSDVRRKRRMNHHRARPRLVGAEGAAHLVAVDVRGFRRLLRSHAELDDVQEELEQVLVL